MLFRSNNILSFVQLEAGKITIEREPTRLRELIQSICRSFRYEATDRGLDLAAEIHENVPAVTMLDPGRLRQVLFNLVGNSMKFTERGRVSIRASLLPFSPAPGEGVLLFSVADTGIGIPDDKQDMVFEPFTQADSSLQRKRHGTGIGLGVVRQMVRLMGGSVCVESAAGAGTAMHFTVRCGLALPVRARQGRRKNGQATELAGLRVLLAEDDRVNRLAATRFLERLGCVAAGAENGRQAMEMLRKGDYDCIIMDIQMPEMDGLEATRAIRTDESGDFDPAIPIVALTAHALKGDRETFLHAGMNEYLSKPVSPEALAAALARAMGEAAPAEADASPSGSAPAPCDETPEVLVWAELLTKARGNTGFLMKLFAAFVAEQPGNLEIIREALARSDHGQLAFLAHALKGAAATMCAPFLRQACLDLERAAKENDAALERTAFEAMETALREVMQAMRERLENDATAGTPCAR